MTSVTRKTHMPSVDDSNCCSLSSKWCRKPGSCTARVVSPSANLHLLLFTGVVVSRLGHNRWSLEVEGRRGGGGECPHSKPFAFHGFCGALGPFRQAHAR